MKTTYLYVKEHSLTGLKYFGKTTNLNNSSYKGSGTYWKNHIKKHGKQYVRTLWISEPFFDNNNLEEFALFFSETYDIVNSDNWANLKLENGLDGGVPDTDEIKHKKSVSRIGNKNPMFGKKRTNVELEGSIKKNSKNWKFIKDGQVISVTNLKQFCRDNNLSFRCMQFVNSGKSRHKSHKGYTRYEVI